MGPTFPTRIPWGMMGLPHRNDWLASIVVFLVALPLCMGIALASGVPVSAGLMSGIIGGLLVGSIAGCPLQVSGPAAGLTVIVLDIVRDHGVEMLGLVVTIASLIQLVAGFVGIGQWFRAVSPAVIHGMLAGIGFLILGSQFHVMIDDRPHGGGAANLAAIPQAVIKSLELPDFGPPEVRKFHTDLLRSAGEMHRQQNQVKEWLIESLPLHSPSRVPQAGAETHRILLETLLKSQQSIHDNLERLEKEATEVHRSEIEGDLELAIHQAAEAVRRAANDLRSAVSAGAIPRSTDEAAPLLATQSTASKALENLLAHAKNHHLAAYLGILTILTIIIWQVVAPRPLRIIPAPLAGALVATVVAAWFSVPVLYVEVPDRVWEDMHLPHWDLLLEGNQRQILLMGLLMATVASAETLLCASAVDKMQSGTRTDYDRELIAQGIGNLTCGLVGALPITGVIVRSSANIQAGGKTRWSAILHGLWLLIFVFALGWLLRYIPTASLAAILVYTGFRLIDTRHLASLWRVGWTEAGIYLATLFTIVFTDLLSGVLLGIALSAIKLFIVFSRLSTKAEYDHGTNTTTLSIGGAATFVRLPQLAAQLEKVPSNTHLHVDLEHLTYIDHACLELLTDWAERHRHEGGTLTLDWESLHARAR